MPTPEERDAIAAAQLMTGELERFSEQVRGQDTASFWHQLRQVDSVLAVDCFNPHESDLEYAQRRMRELGIR